MFKFIKNKIKEYKRIKEVKFITDHLMKALTTFVYNDNYLPNFSLIETDKKKHPLYNINSENFKNEYDYLDVQSLSEYYLRNLYFQYPMLAGMIFYHGKTDKNSPVGADYLQEGEEPDCVIVDLQTIDGASYVVVQYKKEPSDVMQVVDVKMYRAVNKYFFNPGDIYYREINDFVVFFKILKTELDGVHIFCYSNKLSFEELENPTSYKIELSEDSDEEFVNLIQSLVETASEENYYNMDLHDLDGTIYEQCHIPGSHVPVSWDYFLQWTMELHSTTTVEDDELNGYRIWKENSGMFFNL